MARTLNSPFGPGPVYQAGTARWKGAKSKSLPDYKKYTECMLEIKMRLQVIGAISKGDYSTPFPITNIEVIGLQFRKIFELIVLSSIATHYDQYEKSRSAFKKDWDISKIIAVVSKINPDFYPRPVKVYAGTDPNAFHQHEPVVDGFLTLDKLKKAHGVLGELLHAKNPYAADWTLEDYKNRFDLWMRLTLRLLETHQVRLDKTSYLFVTMDTGTDGQVHSSYFEKIPSER